MSNLPLGIRPPWGQGPCVPAIPNHLPFPGNPIMQLPIPASGTVGMGGGGWSGRRMKVCPHCKGCGLVEDDEGINVNPNEGDPETSSTQDEEEEADSAGEEQGVDEGDTSMQEISEQEGEERKKRGEDVRWGQPFAHAFVPSVQGGAGVPPMAPAIYGGGFFPPPVRPPLPEHPGLRLLAPRLPPGVNTVEEDRMELPVETGVTKKGDSLLCDVCQFESTSQLVMDRHVATHTMKTMYFKCTHTSCHERFASEEQREKHLRKHKTSACASEGCYVTWKLPDFIIQERKHTGEKPFTCEHPGCGGRFVSRTSLRSHTKERHSNLPLEQIKPFACTYAGCLFRARQKGQLEEHLRSHTGEKPFSCPFPGCSATFGTKGHLGSHTKRHLGTRRFPCSFEGCSYSAMDKEVLIAHTRIHTGEKPFECKECGFRFRQVQNLRTHVKAQHGKGK